MGEMNCGQYASADWNANVPALSLKIVVRAIHSSKSVPPTTASGLLARCAHTACAFSIAYCAASEVEMPMFDCRRLEMNFWSVAENCTCAGVEVVVVVDDVGGGGAAGAAGGAGGTVVDATGGV